MLFGLRKQDLLYSHSEGMCALESYVYLNTLLCQDLRQKDLKVFLIKLPNW